MSSATSPSQPPCLLPAQHFLSPVLLIRILVNRENPIQMRSERDERKIKGGRENRYETIGSGNNNQDHGTKKTKQREHFLSAKRVVSVVLLSYCCLSVSCCISSSCRHLVHSLLSPSQVMLISCPFSHWLLLRVACLLSFRLQSLSKCESVRRSEN